MLSINLMGEVKDRGTFNIAENTSIRDIIYKNGGGIKKNKRLKMVQLGGPLGVCIRGSEINNSIGKYHDDMYLNTVMVYNEVFCPVDFMRFVTRFLIRELKIDNSRIRELNRHIEDIANGRSSFRSMDNIKGIVGEVVSTRGEILANRVMKQVIDFYEDEIVEHINYKRCKSGICRGLMIAQCVNACPAGVHIPGYVELMKNGDNVQAYNLMRKTNPLSLVCGKVCARPCEDRCRRGEIESTVGVRALQRYASESALNIEGFTEETLPNKPKDIGIIGAGPGGLTSAYYLAKSGYAVTIYEAMDRVGGMLAYGVPEYRLPYADLYKEIKTIMDIGVSIKTGIKVGKDISFDEVEGNHDATIIATGAHKAMMLPEFKGYNIVGAIDFLKRVTIDQSYKVKERILILGGGDVALDSARTCIRLGAKEVYVVSLEQYDDMPAGEEEKEHGKVEGIRFISGYGISELKNSDDGLQVKLVECSRVFDEEYNFNPVYNTDLSMDLEVDEIIMAIGQRPELDFVDETDVDVNRGYIYVDNRFMTSKEGVFALGDVTGIGIAIEAIAEGRIVASVVDEYLGGSGIYYGKDIEIPETPLNITLWDIAMVKEGCTLSENRRSFDEVTSTYNQDQAKIEASRCMRCDRNSIRELLLKPRIV